MQDEIRGFPETLNEQRAPTDEIRSDAELKGSIRKNVIKRLQLLIEHFEKGHYPIVGCGTYKSHSAIGYNDVLQLSLLIDVEKGFINLISEQNRENN